MYFDEWGRWLRRLARQVHGNTRQRNRHRSRPGLELLEDRVTPSATAQIDSGGAQGEFNAGDNISYHGGKLIDNVKIEPIFLKDSSTGTTSPYKSTIDSFFTSITSDQFIASMLSAYSVGSYTIGNGSKGNDDVNVPVSCDTTAAGFASISDLNIQNVISQQINLGNTAPTTANTLYFVFTPPGDAVGDNVNGNSVNGFLGYHADFLNGSTDTLYAVIPDPSAPTDRTLENSIASGGWGFTNAQQVTAVSSHEMAEAITDPTTPAAWYNTPLGFSGEIGDLAAGQTYTLDGFMTQYMWSNALIGPAHAPGSSGNVNNLFINQLTPPAVDNLTNFPVATFTDPNPAQNLSNLSCEVDVVYPNGIDHVWTSTITGGANGVYVVNATPTPNLNNGQYGPASPGSYGLDVIITDSGTTLATRQVPFTVATDAPFTYNADNGGITHSFRLVESGANLDLYDNGQLVFFQPVSQTTTVAINADTGTDNSLTIDYSGGTFNTIHAISFDGGNGSGSHALTLIGGSFTNDTYTPSSATGGTINLDGQSIVFSDVATVDDLAAATNFTALRHQRRGPDQRRQRPQRQ